MTKKKPEMDNRNLSCKLCGGTRGLVHKYGLHICRRCFREVAGNIGFMKLN